MHSPIPVIACMQTAETSYGIRVAILKRVMEHARSGIMPMGIDHAWLQILRRVGFDPAQVEADRCINILAGAWIIAHSKRTSPTASISWSWDDRNSAVKLRPLNGCVHQAALVYQVPEQLLRAIIATEGGHVGQVVRNANGSFDMGPAQINSTHLKELSRFGISREALINDGCLNIQVGAWILARSLKGLNPFDDPTEFWRRVGNYNSANPHYNQKYQVIVWKNLSKN